MSTLQWKARLRMVELSDIGPLARGVTDFAAQRSSLLVPCSHAFTELSLVDVLMTSDATELVEMIERQLRTFCRFMAIYTCHSLMRSHECEARFLVFGDRIACRLKGRFVVALLTTIAPWRACKLPLVLILVAVHALSELDLVEGRPACRLMTRGTFHLLVRKYNWESSLGVIPGRKG